MSGIAHLVTRFPAGVYSFDTEYRAVPGSHQVVHCLVVRNLLTGEIWRYDRADLDRLTDCPLPIGPDTLWLAYNVTADALSLLALGWDLPINWVDPYVEYRMQTNVDVDRANRPKCSLLDALAAYGLSGIGKAEKEEMRALAIRGGPFTAEEMHALVVYCQTDVDACSELFTAMLPRLHLDQALLRGGYMAAVARMEFVGIPIDTMQLERMRRHGERLREDMVRAFDPAGAVFDGMHFIGKNWVEYCAKAGIVWPSLPIQASKNPCEATLIAELLGGYDTTRPPDLDEETFEAMANLYPQVVGPMHALRAFLSKTKFDKLAVVKGRCRCGLRPFSTKTARHAPSTNQYPFGLPAWLRGLMMPEPGKAFAYLDYKSQEFGAAAVLGNDGNMLQAYEFTDPYLGFAYLAGAVPKDATKETHEAERDQFKAIVLGVQYAMGITSLAASVGGSVDKARDLLLAHRRTFSRYWGWVGNRIEHALATGSITASFGWTMQTSDQTNRRTLGNWPLQSNGSEMLRIAIMRAQALGVEVVAPVHDAILIHAPADQLEHHITLATEAMQYASRQVLAGYSLKVGVDRFHTRFFDKKRDGGMWADIQTRMDTYDGSPDHG